MNEQPSGFLLIDKPAGITSHDVVDRLRRLTGIKKIGHAGTLDPFATGLLIVAVSRQATRKLSTFVGMDKTYEAEFILGASTESLDTETAVEPDVTFRPPTVSQISTALQSLTGDLLQLPPMHSAIKVAGKKLYELARKGIKIERAPRPVTIFQFDLLTEPQTENNLTVLSLHIACSSGTYIRSLARDLAEKLNTTGYTRTLRRTSIGPFLVTKAIALADLTPENWAQQLQNLTLTNKGVA